MIPAPVMTPATAETPQPRCSFKGCPVRFAAGADRLCRGHLDDSPGTVPTRAAELGVMMELAPGEHGSETAR